MAVLSLGDSVIQLNSAMRSLLGGSADAGARGRDVLGQDAVSEIERSVQEGHRDGTVEVNVGDAPPTGLSVSWSLLSGPSDAPRLVTLSSATGAASARLATDSRWRQVLSRAVDLSWTADETGAVLSITPGLALGSGWRGESLLGNRWLALIHPEDRAVARAVWERVLHGGRTETEAFDARAGLGDGAWRWLRITITDMRAEPSIGAVVGTAVGIFDAGATLVSSPGLNAEFRARYTQSGLPQMMLDLTGRIVSVNDAYCELLGRDRSELVGIDSAALIHADDETGNSAFDAILASGIDHARLARVMLGEEGRAIPVEVDVTILRGDTGEVVGAAAFIYDLTEIRRGESQATQDDAFASAAAFLAGDMGLVGDIAGNLAYVTPELARVLGVASEELLGTQRWGLIHPEDLPAVLGVYADVADDGEARSVSYRIRMGDGRWRCFEAKVAPFSGASLDGLVCSLRDITAQVEAESALKSATALHDAITATTEEGFLAVSTKGRTLYANERMASLLGIRLIDLYEHPPPILATAADPRGRSGSTADPLDTQDLPYTRPDGAERQLRTTRTALTAPDGTATGALIMISDVTDARRLESHLRAAALQDPLTRLLNRAAFLEKVGSVLASDARQVGVLFANLDDFRGLNDSLGRSAGDEVLVAVADRLRRVLGTHDIAARVGADEFAVLVQDSEPAAVERLGRAVLASIAKPLAIDGAAVEVTAAVGAACAAPATAGELLHYADMAMRVAKASGDGVLVAHDQTEADATEREEALGAELRTALSQDELDMRFQPVIDLTTGAVVGMEALARWTHATLGAIDPVRIVATAERFGLSSELDRWALRTAFRGARTLQRTGVTSRDAYVSVNLTAGNLGARGLEEYIVNEVPAAGLTPAHVLLEMTETAIMDDAEVVTSMLRRLRTRGFRIALDDFGTGYSSLAYLRDLPVSMLKIDRSFVSEIRSDSDAFAIVASIVDLARAIGVTAVAKGAETLDQARLLRELGCECAQGWLWSPAMSLEEISATRTWARPFDIGAARLEVAPVRRERFPVGPEHGLDRMLSMHGKGASLSTIAASLNADGYFTPKGLRWHGTSVARAIADAAYIRPEAAREQPNRG